jgi:hypothetical protein
MKVEIDRNKQTVFLIIIAFLAIAIGYLYFTNKKSEKLAIINNCEFVEGELSRISKLVGSAGRLVSYRYQADGISYFNQVRSNNNNIDSCYLNMNKCDSLRFWVAYDIEDPSSSMIDLSLPIQKNENPRITRRLKHFEN